MSLVGTRPILQDELQKYELHHRARIAIKPGITGMWQVSGRSDITDFEEVVRLDTEYISNWTFQDYFKNTYDRDTWFIPNGVNRPEIRKAELITQKFGLTENSYILFLGRLVPEKGMPVFLIIIKNIVFENKIIVII